MSIITIKIIEENGIQYDVHIDTFGTIVWHKHNTKIIHREYGPALEYADGTKFWCKNGNIHREDGPAAELVNGDKVWYKDNLYYRQNGPAIEYANGDKAWCNKEGKFHREDGPAIERHTGQNEYWLNNKLIEDIKTNEELMIKLLLE